MICSQSTVRYNLNMCIDTQQSSSVYIITTTTPYDMSFGSLGADLGTP
ncbi:hypothetical protein VCHA42O253_80125 [Vibrio chagasii]|nr:hypothetical protein VCHA29O37_20273 [Vibrio chagasii]CAH7075511.1 hypothetical protein VCHA48P437_10098 [Vibrio chagasii]CAH7167289.1 hypothetical protein VCHA43P275_20109 [Vibrio chagasii]CAH7199638.1 hypothetical protein VCHA44O286_20004 [Vibrio chagasii]CAH7444775.1 hypothetical protein VCHA53O473_90109 [Vibrio chagasii]